MKLAQDKKPHLPIWRGLLFAIFGGGMMYAVFPPLELGFLVWFGLIPLMTALWTGPRRTGWRGIGVYALYGWVWGLVFYGSMFFWLNEVTSLGYGPCVTYLAAHPALWAVFMGTIFRPVLLVAPAQDAVTPALGYSSERQAAWRAWTMAQIGVTVRVVLSGSALWVCVEFLRNTLVAGFGWNSLGVGLYTALPFAQWAEWVGATGLAFLPAMVNIWVWCLGWRYVRMFQECGLRIRQWDVYGLGIILCIMCCVGLLRMAQFAPNTDEVANTIPVMTVQLNLTQKEKWDRSNLPAIYNALAVETLEGYQRCEAIIAQKMEQGEDCHFDVPAWVIWPESSLPESNHFSKKTKNLLVEEQWNTVFFSAAGPIAQVRNAVASDFVVLTGEDETWWGESDETNEVPAREFHNLLTAYPTDFSSRIPFRKVCLVPFGEYIPFRKEMPWLERAFESSAGFAMGMNMTAGTSYDPIIVPVSPHSQDTIGVIPLVCFEDTIASHVRQFVRAEPQIMVNVTNDGWFNRSIANEHHWRNAAFRCIELRRSMVRAANTGVSVAIAPNGAVIASLRDESGSPFMRGSMFARLPLGDRCITLYSILGDWFVALCSLWVVCMVGLRWRVQKSCQK